MVANPATDPKRPAGIMTEGMVDVFTPARNAETARSRTTISALKTTLAKVRMKIDTRYQALALDCSELRA